MFDDEAKTEPELQKMSIKCTIRTVCQNHGINCSLASLYLSVSGINLKSVLVSFDWSEVATLYEACSLAFKILVLCQIFGFSRLGQTYHSFCHSSVLHGIPLWGASKAVLAENFLAWNLSQSGYSCIPLHLQYLECLLLYGALDKFPL
jgi:hypothetical protein